MGHWKIKMTVNIQDNFIRPPLRYPLISCLAHLLKPVPEFYVTFFLHPLVRQQFKAHQITPVFVDWMNMAVQAFSHFHIPTLYLLYTKLATTMVVLLGDVTHSLTCTSLLSSALM